LPVTTAAGTDAAGRDSELSFCPSPLWSFFDDVGFFGSRADPG
jgi:hypothetical protein